MNDRGTSLLTQIALLASAIACRPTGPGPEPRERDATVPPPCAAAERLDELLARLDEELGAQGIPGAGAAIACANGAVVAGGVGVTRAGGDAQVEGDTRFQIASITKTLTAATAVLLEEDGLLDRGAPFDELVSGVNARAPYQTPFTLEQLLAHTAGYPTEIPDGDYSASDLDRFYRANADVLLWSPPGRVWNYANYGYGLAGYALQQLAGVPFGELVTTRLFEAAGMMDARMDAATVADEGAFASGHTGSAQAPAARTPLDSYYRAGWYGPMGGAWVSAADLARFAALLLDDGEAAPLSALRRELPVKRSRTDSAPDRFYGQGLFIDESGTAPVWSHGGGVEGYLSDLSIFPAAGVAVVVLINADYGFPSATLEWARGELGGVQRIEEWGELESADIVGTYHDPQVLGRVTVTQAAGALTAVFEDLDFRAELIPWDTDTAYFRYEPWDFEMTMAFWRDETGAVDLLSCMAGVAARSE